MLGRCVFNVFVDASRKEDFASSPHSLSNISLFLVLEVS